MVHNDAGIEVTDFHTDDNGKFRVALPPSRYTLSAGQPTPPQLAPTDVTVPEQGLVQITLLLDTGIR